MSYDSSGRMSAFAAAGGVTTSYTYDGSLLKGEAWSGPIAGNVARSYDASLRPASYSINGATTVSFAYDGDGLLTGAGDLAITRDAQHGLPIGSLLDSLSATTAYSGFGELTSFSAASNGSALFSDAISRDALGRVVQKTETMGGVTSTPTPTARPVNSATASKNARRSKPTRTTATAIAPARRWRGTPVSASYDDQDRIVQYGTAVHSYNGAGDLLAKTDGTNHKLPVRSAR